MDTRNAFSRPIGATVALALGVGVVTGAVEYAHRSSVVEPHSSDTAAWPVHLVLTGVAIAWLGATAVLAHRRHTTLTGVLTAPLRQRAARRTLAALRTPRAIPAALLGVVILYNACRVGEQVIGGLDPNFTANAWGGPGYFGAMYCHYLDVGLITAAATLLLHLVLPRTPRAVVDQPTRSAYSG